MNNYIESILSNKKVKKDINNSYTNKNTISKIYTNIRNAIREKNIYNPNVNNYFESVNKNNISDYLKNLINNQEYGEIYNYYVKILRNPKQNFNENDRIFLKTAHKKIYPEEFYRLKFSNETYDTIQKKNPDDRDEYKKTNFKKSKSKISKSESEEEEKTKSKTKTKTKAIAIASAIASIGVAYIGNKIFNNLSKNKKINNEEIIKNVPQDVLNNYIPQKTKEYKKNEIYISEKTKEIKEKEKKLAYNILQKKRSNIKKLISKKKNLEKIKK